MFGGRCRVVSTRGQIIRCWLARWLYVFTFGLPGPRPRARLGPRGCPRRCRCVEGITSHDGAQRRGTDNKAPGAGKKPGRRGNRGQRSSNGPETTGEPSYPLAQGGNQEETSPTEATEKEATEVSAFAPILSSFFTAILPFSVSFLLLLARFLRQREP